MSDKTCVWHPTTELPVVSEGNISINLLVRREWFITDTGYEIISYYENDKLDAFIAWMYIPE